MDRKPVPYSINVFLRWEPRRQFVGTGVSRLPIVKHSGPAATCCSVPDLTEGARRFGRRRATPPCQLHSRTRRNRAYWAARTGEDRWYRPETQRLYDPRPQMPGREKRISQVPAKTGQIHERQICLIFMLSCTKSQPRYALGRVSARTASQVALRQRDTSNGSVHSRSGRFLSQRAVIQAPARLRVAQECFTTTMMR
jgi:hypothetical protein